MKPLTVEELKELPTGDWVWVVDISDCGNRDRGSYRQIDVKNDDDIMLDGQCYGARRYKDYGTKWLAYKNKEASEQKDDVYKQAFELILDDVYNTRLQADTLSCSGCPFLEEIFDECENQGLYSDCKKRWKEYYLKKACEQCGQQEQTESEYDFKMMYNAFHGVFVAFCADLNNKDFREYYYKLTPGGRAKYVEDLADKKYEELKRR